MHVKRGRDSSEYVSIDVSTLIANYILLALTLYSCNARAFYRNARRDTALGCALIFISAVNIHARKGAAFLSRARVIFFSTCSLDATFFWPQVKDMYETRLCLLRYE